MRGAILEWRKYLPHVNLDKRVFIPIKNSDNGKVGNQTVFTFSQSGETFHADYKGGDIAKGSIIGTFSNQRDAHLLYQCITTSGELKAGKAVATFTQTDNRVSIHMSWQWLNGDNSTGISHYIEVKNDT